MLLYFVVWVGDWKMVWFFLLAMLSLDPYPRIAGDSHILFQPITAISSLLDLFGPLPQGRRLFGPTVLESKQPSRKLLIFSGIRCIPMYTDGKKSERVLLQDFEFPVLEFKQEAGRKSQKRKSCLNPQKLQVDFISYRFLFYVKINVTTFRFNVKNLKLLIFLQHQYINTFILLSYYISC